MTATAGASVLIGVPAAWLTVRTDLRRRRWWTILLAVPLVIPSYVGAFALVGALGPRGCCRARYFRRRAPAVDLRLLGAWLAITLFSYPYVFLSARAGSANRSGAGGSVRHAGPVRAGDVPARDAPQNRPVDPAGALLVALYTLSDFGAVSIMQYSVFTRAIYLRLSLNLDLAALLSLVLVAFTVALLAVSARAERRTYPATGRTHRAPRRVALGRWQWAAVAFCAAVVALALVAPLGVMAYWLVNGVQHGETLRDVFAPLQRSLRAAAVAAGGQRPAGPAVRLPPGCATPAGWRLYRARGLRGLCAAGRGGGAVVRVPGRGR